MDSVVKEIVVNTIKSNFIMSLATIVDAKAHICTVFYVTDDDKTLYFRSRTQSKHSVVFASNPQGAVSIYNPTSNYSVKSGFQAHGKVERVKDLPEMAGAVKLYVQAFKESETKFEALPQLIMESVKSTMFKFTIESVKVLDSVKDIHTEEYELYL